MMVFIVIYNIDGVLTDQQFNADSFIQALQELHFYLPNRAQVIAIYDTAMVAIKKTPKGNIKLKVHQIT